MNMDKIKNFRGGQSLVEILIALGIGVLLIGAIATILTANLKSSLTIKTTQAVASFSQELLDSVKSWASADWHNISGLAHGSGNPYYLVSASVTSSIAIAGQESIFVNDINSGLVGYWKLDEATGTVAYDSSGNYKTGNFSGSPTKIFSPNCKAGNCLSFNGTTDYISVPILVSGTDGTISFWVKNAAYRTGGYLFRSDANIRTYFDITASNQVTFYKGDPAVVVGQATTIIPGNWNMLTLDWRNDSGIEKASAYINGVPIATDVVFTNTTQGSYLTIAAFTTGGTQNAAGIFDDIRIYNRALSASEVQALYNNFVYSRYFYVDNVNRDSCGIGSISSSATTSCTFGGAGISDDPSTQKVTSVIKDSNNNTLLTEHEYLTRSRNYSFNQSNWSGGSGQNGIILQPNSLFSSSTNINYASGTLQVILP